MCLWSRPLPHRVEAGVRFYISKVSCHATVGMRSRVILKDICPTAILLEGALCLLKCNIYFNKTMPVWISVSLATFTQDEVQYWLNLYPAHKRFYICCFGPRGSFSSLVFEILCCTGNDALILVTEASLKHIEEEVVCLQWQLSWLYIQNRSTILACGLTSWDCIRWCQTGRSLDQFKSWLLLVSPMISWSTKII